LFFNLTIALFMSIPVINLYMHGTHFITAHAMGTTIGINTMILLAAVFYFLLPEREKHQSKWLKTGFWGAQVSLFVFLMALMAMGVTKTLWFFDEPQVSFGEMMERNAIWILLFIISGIGILVSFLILTTNLLVKALKNRIFIK